MARPWLAVVIELYARPDPAGAAVADAARTCFRPLPVSYTHLTLPTTERV